MKYWPSGGWAFTHTGALTRENTVYIFFNTYGSHLGCTVALRTIEIACIFPSPHYGHHNTSSEKVSIKIDSMFNFQY